MKDSWEEHAGAKIQDKVRQCGHTLEAWGREVTGNFGKRVKECKLELKHLRDKTDGDSVEKFKAAKQRLFRILDQQEMFWR